jgi:hypothetical protein
VTCRQCEPFPSLPSYIELCAKLPHSEELDGNGRFVVAPLVEKAPLSPDCLQRLALAGKTSKGHVRSICSGSSALQALVDFSQELPDWVANTPSVRAILKTAKRTIKEATEKVIGRATITRIGSHDPLTCLITKSFGYSKQIDRVVPVFTAYLEQTGEKVGKCLYEILPEYSDCEDMTYNSHPVSAIIRIDSFARATFRGIGTTLMQATMEEGMRRGTEGRIALHSEGPALGFYYKLGMRPAYTDPIMERNIQEELKNASTAHRKPTDLLDGDALSMFLPPEGIQKWTEIIRSNSVLNPRKPK